MTEDVEGSPHELRDSMDPALSKGTGACMIVQAPGRSIVMLDLSGRGEDIKIRNGSVERRSPLKRRDVWAEARWTR